jgi:small subunit ribosomal protein S19
MPRSVKKGPFINYKLAQRIKQLNDTNQKRIIKTWSRASIITPDFVGHTIAVHNGNKMIPIFITENMVGHKLGEFAPTRIFRGHPGTKAEKAAKATTT